MCADVGEVTPPATVIRSRSRILARAAGDRGSTDTTSAPSFGIDRKVRPSGASAAEPAAASGGGHGSMLLPMDGEYALHARIWPHV